MTVAITTTDNADNSGMLATIIGSDSGSINSVYVSPVNEGNSPLAWVLVAMRTGDGTVNLPVAAGYWFCHVAASLVSGVPALSPPIIGAASLAVLCNQVEIELAIQARIQTLTLTGLATPPGDIPPGLVYRFDTPMSDDLLPIVQTPCVIVTPASLPETVDGRLTGKDDLGYPVQVLILANFAPRQQGIADTIKNWRHSIMASLRFQRLSTVPYVLKVVPEPQAVIQWKPPEFLFAYSAVVYRAVTREPRGAGT